MIVHRVEQGSPEWLFLRLGIPTASRFDKIITPKKRERTSAGAQGGYMAELMAEWALQAPLDDKSSLFMERGTQSEESAFAKYELLRDVEVDRVGFITDDAGLVGCSPDGLVGEDGDLELKCPNAKTHMDYLINGVPADYDCQLQGRLWITKRRWTDFMSWHPTLPPVLIRFARDEAFIACIAREVTSFSRRLQEEKAKLLASGYTLPEPYSVVAARAHEGETISDASVAGEQLT
jgi:hypothetical protein